jgi:membrane protein required for colicin V production
MNLSFQFLDIAVVLIVVASAAYATYRGLVSESLAVFGWIAAAYATLYFGPWVAWWMQDMMKPQWIGQAAGFLLVFLIVLIPLQFASSRISQNVKKSQVGTLDSVLGTGFGILRGVAIVGIAYLVFVMYAPNPYPSWLVNARLYPVVRGSAAVVASLIPDQKIRAPEKPHANPNDSSDPIGGLIDQSPSEPAPLPPKSQAKPGENPPPAAAPVAPKPKPAKHAKKTYGAKDRHALDRLIETNSSDKSGKP